MQNNNVSTIQKIAAYLIIILTVCSFTIMRTHKNQSTKEKQEAFRTEIESVLSNSLLHLYNNDLENTVCEYINPEFTDVLNNKFKKANSIMSSSELVLSNVKLNKNRIYSTTKKKVKYVIYDGTVELQWINKKTNTKTDKAIKGIKGYVLKDKDSERYSLANIELNNLEWEIPL